MPQSATWRRFHPRHWPLAGWVLLSLGANALRVDYTLGAFSFAPAIALLSGTWLGHRRGALSQALATGCLAALSVLLPGTVPGNEWGFHLGHIAAAMVAGRIAPPDDAGAHPRGRVKLVVWSTAVLTAMVIWRSGFQIAPPPAGRYFVLTFLMAAVIVLFYAWRLLPEPARVLGYAYCLLPYYALGLGWTWGFAHAVPVLARAIDTPTSAAAILFHGYLTHLPGDLIGIVVIAYLVCAFDRADIGELWQH
ncbi:MAG: hypothetical protein ACE5HV_16170 [Acidobacteriota bacterium]